MTAARFVHLSETRLPPLQVLQQTFYPFLPIDCCEFIFKGVVFENAVGGRIGSLVLYDTGAKTVERVGLVLRVRNCSGGVGFADDACATMLCDKHLAGGLSLLQLLLKLCERAAKGLGFGGLVFELLCEAVGQVLMTQAARECGAGKIVLLTVDGEFRFTMPLLHGVLMFFLLLVQKMLVGDGDRDLGFDLKQLVFHVDDELFR